MYWIIGAIVLITIFLVLPSHRISKRVRKIQDIVSKQPWDFDVYVNTTDFEFNDNKAKDSIRIMYESPFGLRSKYLTYKGTKPIVEALDELISHFK